MSKDVFISFHTFRIPISPHIKAILVYAEEIMNTQECHKKRKKK